MGETRIPPRYRVIEEVGHGGMAVVYRARDQVLMREVAIKLLHQHLATEPESKARLEREAQAVAKLRHDNILEIFDYSGTASEASYIITEFIDGRTMKQFLADRSIAYPEVAALIAAELGGALAHAHSLGIIHRDVKPENVMIRKDGVLKLTDFGIAQVVDLQRMTVTGQLLGSPAYMAPELIEGKPLDFRTDVFSVGIMLYQLATGNLPFAGKNPHEVLKRISEGRYLDPRAACRLVSDGLQRIIARSLARRPDDRYPDVAHLAEDLREYLKEAGLMDLRGELAAFFTDPAAYEGALPARLCKALAEGGKAHLAAGRTARAMDLWNRALALDHSHPDVLAGLARLEGRRRLQTLAIVIAGAACAAGVVFGISRRATEPPPPPVDMAGSEPVGAGSARTGAAPARPPESAGELAPPDTSVPPGGKSYEKSLRRPKVAAAVKPETASPPSMAPPAAAPASAALPPAPRVFRIGPTPPNVDVYLDGEMLHSYGPGKNTVTVPWDRTHKLELRSPSGCCEPATFELGPDKPIPPGDHIVVRLPWKPAQLTVVAQPQRDDIRILVEAEEWKKPRLFAHGRVMSIAFAPCDPGRKKIEVSAFAGNELKITRSEVMAAGQSHTVVLEVGE